MNINDLYNTYNTLNPASCVSNITQGSTHVIKITAGNGVGPYFYSLAVDGVLKLGFINVQMYYNPTSVNYVFNESVGSHTFGIYVKDSCSTPKTSSVDVCTINILSSCTIPTCSFTIV